MDTAGNDVRTKAPRLYRRIMNGEYSLARTFWLYFVLTNGLIQFVYINVFQTQLVGSPLLVFVGSMLLVWWRMVTLIGVWRACDNSTIHRVFIYLIRGLVVIWSMGNIADFLYIFRLIPYL